MRIMLQERIGPEGCAAEPGYFCREIPCHELGETEINQAVSLVAQMGVPETYILPRLNSYHTMVTYLQHNRMLAFQLVQEFWCGGKVYVYFGPAFSRGGALLQLYAWYIKELDRKFPGQEVFILAEIQNPNMLMVLHGLFGDFGYSFINETIPAGIRKAVPLYCRQYSHIGRYNPHNFTTSSPYSLFKETGGCQGLKELIARHNIFPVNGDNMLFAARLPAGTQKRKAVVLQVSQGIEKVSRWGKFKNDFLSGLKRSE